jgi:hypothetical protein
MGRFHSPIQEGIPPLKGWALFLNAFHHVQPVALLEILAEYSEEKGLPKTANIHRIFLETLRETIKITGKNVDDLDLEKLGTLIQQTNKKSSKVDLKGLFKTLKEQLPSKKKNELDVPNQRTVPDEHS